jgi:hypothetical protein
VFNLFTVEVAITMRVPFQNIFAGALWLLIGLVFSQRLFASDRVALVVGCANYVIKGGSLATPLNDADDITKTLREALGFTVIEKRDAKREDFIEGLTELREEAKNAEIALVYFSGHGMELDQANYCIPVDAKLEKPSQLESQTVPLQTILHDCLDKTGTSAKVVILDACRNNPFPQTKAWRRGKNLVSPGVLAELGPAEMPKGLLISFAAAPGRIAAAFSDEDARNSLYTEFLLKHLTDQGKNLRDIFENVQEEVSTATSEKQVPYVNYEGGSSIVRKLVLIPAQGGEHKNSPTPAATPLVATPASQPQWPRYRTNPRALGYSDLRVRSGPGTTYQTVKIIPENVIVQQTSGSEMNGPTEWIPIEYQPATGAVIRGFVTSKCLQRLP